MEEQVPQQAMPGGIPDPLKEAPQVPVAAMAGPDSTKLPPNPLAQPGPQGNQTRDWENSYKGLMKTYQEEKQEREQLASTVKALVERLESLEKGAPVAPEPPAATPPVPKEAPKPDALYERVVEMEAQSYRDQLLMEYMQPGQPGQNLPLFTFRQNIKAIAPSLGEDGKMDDSAQRKEIERFIGGLRAVQGTTQQAMAAGWTPGVSPAPSAQQTEQQLIDEYYRVKEQYGSQQFSSPEEANRVAARYYELHDKVGKNLPGQSQPWANVGQIAETMQQVLARVGHLEGFMLKK